MGVNTNYKDSVFSFLFSDPDTLRELYGAIAGLELPPDLPVTINTLEGVLYRNLLNDISFEIGKKLVVILEHQSTVNPNLPLRVLMYIARVYEKLTAGRNVYGRKKLLIPRPEFIVLYNGKEPYAEKVELRLSEAFEAAGVLGRGGEIPLELALTVYNINRGHNGEMVERCEKLRGYSEFIGKVRELEGERGDREAAMEGAVRWCIGEGILRDFFEEHGTEVVNMLMAEWKLEDALVVEREEGREEGWEERGERDREDTIRNLLDFGMKAEQISRALKLPLDTIERYLK
ncbi:MAG: Rpn family recombination-promoting nuclease/putative transposase [Treponema sp.]|nr:Rpn family recombination-promoting nuclease/putative transposase [Treponema sp.]